MKKVTLFILVVLGLGAAAQAQMPVPGGIFLVDGGGKVSVRFRPAQDFTNVSFSQVQFTLRYPGTSDIALGAVTSSHGVSAVSSGTEGAYEYQVYGATPNTSVTFSSSVEYELAQIALTGSSGFVELAPYSYASPFNGEYYVELNGNGYFDPSGTNEFYQSNIGALPVELVSFDAVLDGAAALLRWQTASETNNAGFEVEHAAGEADFARVAFAQGFGTTVEARQYAYRFEELAPGRHRFRLKQIDFDGTFAYSPVVEVAVEMPGRFVLEPAYPNPFNPESTIRFTAAELQAVRVELYNAVGQQLAVLFDETVGAGEAQTVRVNGAGLPSGLYLVRVTGASFVATQKLALVK